MEFWEGVAEAEYNDKLFQAMTVGYREEIEALRRQVDELSAALKSITQAASAILETAEADATASMVYVDQSDLGRLHMARDKARAALARQEVTE